LARRSGDFDAADDAVQEALVAAADHWPSDGLPADPRAWLTAVAGRRLIDQRRSDRARADRELATGLDEPATESSDRDDSLTLLFMCCHPALTPASAIALTLRAVGGLTTAEIAAAFLVPESTMAQRISRAKQRIRESGASFGPPTADEREARLRSVLHVLYLIFNEGYAAASGRNLLRVELSSEAIRLTRMVHAELPDDPEVTGLLALMLLTDARRPARLDANDEPIPLPDQDRARWDHAQIAEGLALLDEAIAAGRVGEYQLDAAIAAVHDRAPSAEATDWSQILALYGLLERMTGNPIVTVNRAVAASMVHGPAAGLEILASVEPRLGGNHRVEAVRGHLLEQQGEADAAVAAYRHAAALTTNLAEQRHLTRQAARVTRDSRSAP
jgi:RNA polymerase sigma factor (sigma-70 family)